MKIKAECNNFEFFVYRNILKAIDFFIACGIDGCIFFVKTVCVVGNFVYSFSIFFGEQRRKIRLSPAKSTEYVNSNWNLV